MKNQSNLTGVVLCAGKGERIKQLPFNKPKALLEILGQPIIYYQLKYLKNVGIKKVLIVIGKFGHEIIKTIKTFPNLNLDITFVKDPNPRGIADSLNKTKSYIKGPLLVFLGDIFLKEVKLKKMLKKFNIFNSSCVLASIKEKNKNNLKKNFTIQVNKDSIVERVVEKPKKPETNIKGVGIYLFSKNIFNAINKTSFIQSHNKELGITEAIQTLIDNGDIVRSSMCVKEDVNINEPLDLWKTNIKLLKKLKRKNFISKNVHIGKNVLITNSIVGPNVNIGDNSLIKDSVIFSGAKVNKKSSLIRCIKTKMNFIKLK